MLYLLDFDRNDSKLGNAAVTGGVSSSTMEEQLDKEPTNPTKPKDFFPFAFCEAV